MNIKTDDKFVFFLRWCADSLKFNEYGIIGIVSQPWKYEKEWERFNQEEYK